MPSLTQNITHGSDAEKSILWELKRRVRLWESGVSSRVDHWRKAEEKILAYMPEKEVDAVRRAAREDGGIPQYTTIQIPYSYAVVMAAHTYWTSVFMGRDPLFQLTARHGETQQAVQANEALLAYQVLRGEMGKYLYTWGYDAFKYGEGIVGLWWDERIDTVSTIYERPVETDPLTGQAIRVEKVIESVRNRTYAGNCIYNVQPQSFIWDTRVTAREFQKGEFAGERRQVSWNDIVRREKMGYYMNIRHIKVKGDTRQWAVGDSGSSQVGRPEELSTSDWSDHRWDSKKRQTHPMVVQVVQLCVEVLPKEWGLPGADWPEKWVFTCTDDFDCLIGVQPLGAMHAKFPYDVIPLEPEGYGLTTRGLPQILEPVQNTVDWLINSHFYNVRASLNNMFVADPSRVVMKDLLDPKPGKVIRLKPEAYGSDTKTAVTQFAVGDVTRQHLQDFPLMIGIGERVGGVNDQIMGMLAAGGRKTATEVRTSTSFGINRLKTISEWSSLVGFEPLTQKLLQNSQQYYDMNLKLAIAGDLAMNAGPGFIQVTPESIAGFYDFVPVDGTLPIDRFAQVELWERLLGNIAQIPAISMQYDLGGIFQWMAQLAGLKNITQFKIQVMPDEVMAAQMQAGNAVPMGGAGGVVRPPTAVGGGAPVAAAAGPAY